MNWLKENWFQIGLVSAALLFALSFMYVQIVQPRINANKLDQCLEVAKSAIQSQWDKECQARGKSEDCRLPSPVVQLIDSRLSDKKNECFRRYE